MQSTPIKHAQLLMEYMATEQGKIVHGISGSGFAKELENKQKAVDSASTQSVTDLPKSLEEIFQSLENAGKEKLFPYMEIAKSIYACSTKAGISKEAVNALSATSSNVQLALAQSDQARRLTITDSMTLDKVLSDLNLPAEARETCKTAENSKGGICLKDLANILDQIKLTPTASDGKAAASDVMALVASLRLDQNKPLSEAKDLGLKQQGSYDLNELRQALNTVIQRTAQTSLKQEQDLPRGNAHASSQNQGKTSGVLSIASREQLANQTQKLASNLVPSTMKNEDDKKRRTCGTITEEIFSQAEKTSEITDSSRVISFFT